MRMRPGVVFSNNNGQPQLTIDSGLALFLRWLLLATAVAAKTSTATTPLVLQPSICLSSFFFNPPHAIYLCYLSIHSSYHIVSRHLMSKGSSIAKIQSSRAATAPEFRTAGLSFSNTCSDWMMHHGLVKVLVFCIYGDWIYFSPHEDFGQTNAWEIVVKNQISDARIVELRRDPSPRIFTAISVPSQSLHFAKAPLQQ
ncbi:hypothetical protein DFJ77DRAFT_475908 [Powellomyces hirtus]|nr:hypothetical protein DFJ77DRAFT_475908 [Powellomyces hirtus]